MREFLETEQAAPSLAQRVNDECAEEEPDSNANGNLDHGRRHVKDDSVHFTIGLGFGGWHVRRGFARGVAATRQHVGRVDAAQQAARRRETTGNLCKDGRNERRGSNTVTNTRVEVGQDTDSQSTQGIGNGTTGLELAAAEKIDNVAGKGNDNHNGHLPPLGLVQDADTQDKGRYKGKGDVRVDGVLALNVRGGVAVDDSVDGGADGDAEAEEEGVDDGIDDADGAGDDGARLELQCRGYCSC
jgi:hypothetical protein